MFVDRKRYKRKELTEEQLEFLQKLMPFGRLMQDMTWNKARPYTKVGVRCSLIMANAIIKSEWGEHPVTVKGNNLVLLKTGRYWCGEKVMHDGEEYRKYSSWLDFSADYTNEITFAEKKLWVPVLSTESLDDQVEIFARGNTILSGRIEVLIERYGLHEFDY